MANPNRFALFAHAKSSFGEMMAAAFHVQLSLQSRRFCGGKRLQNTYVSSTSPIFGKQNGVGASGRQ